MSPLQTAPTTKKGTRGFPVVFFRTAKGDMRQAQIMGPGLASGVKLKIKATGQIIDNVPKATTMRSVNAYFYRG